MSVDIASNPKLYSERIEAELVGRLLHAAGSERLSMLGRAEATGIEPAAFWKPLHREVMRAIMACRDRSGDWGVSLVADELQRADRGDFIPELAKLPDYAFDSSVLEQKVAEVRDRYMARRAYQHLREVAGKVAHGGVDVVQSGDLMKSLGGAVEALARPDSARCGFRMLKDYRERERGQRLYTGSVLDNVIHVTPGTHNVVAALSNHGKTTLLSAVVAGLLVNNPGLRVLWFSCEVPEGLQMSRIASAMTKMREDWLADKNVVPSKAEKRKYSEKVDELAGGFTDRVFPFYWSPIDMDDVRNEAYAVRARFPDDPFVIIVDYMQRATVGSLNLERVNDVGRVSNALAGLSVQLNASTWGVSQFSDRTDESEPIRMPRETKAAWSSEILNDACDFYIYHRPFKKGVPSLCVLEMAKSRYNGHARHVILRGDDSSNSFEWWTDDLPENMPWIDSRKVRPPRYRRRAEEWAG